MMVFFLTPLSDNKEEKIHLRVNEQRKIEQANSTF